MESPIDIQEFFKIMLGLFTHRFFQQDDKFRTITEFDLCFLRSAAWDTETPVLFFSTV